MYFGSSTSLFLFETDWLQVLKETLETMKTYHNRLDAADKHLQAKSRLLCFFCSSNPALCILFRASG